MSTSISELAKVVCKALQENPPQKIPCSVLNGKVFEPKKIAQNLYCYEIYGIRYLGASDGLVKVIDLDSNEFICMIDSEKMEVKYVSPYGKLRFGE